MNACVAILSGGTVSRRTVTLAVQLAGLAFPFQLRFMQERFDIPAILVDITGRIPYNHMPLGVCLLDIIESTR